jgi:UTP--glucose-1-phosphate uridylyltransferase
VADPRPDPDPFAALRRYGFDAQQFAGWQQAVAQGRLSKKNNVVRGPLLPPPAGTVRELPAAGSGARAALERRGGDAIAAGELGVVILNGGMATRFGGVVKGIVDVLAPGRSFLSLCLQDVAAAQRRHGGRVHVFLMNSHATEAATRAHLEEHRCFGLDPRQISQFNQFVSVRMAHDGSLFTLANGEVSPYGPGHGDFPAAFRQSGALQRFLAAGGRHLLVRNVDNLGARIDAAVFGHHLASDRDVTVEVVQKEAGDVGGSPFLHEGRVQLIEQLRYPDGFDAGIVDVFNCNTFTFRARALDRDFELGWYFVEKTVEGRKAVQVEHLIGEVTRELDVDWLAVPRTGPQSRFLAVKTPEDLAAIRAQLAAMYAE